MDATLPKSVELVRSTKTNLSHEHNWFVLPIDNHTPIFSAPQAGDSGCQSCLTWLKNNGYTQTSASFPECNVYTRSG